MSGISTNKYKKASSNIKIDRNEMMTYRNGKDAGYEEGYKQGYEDGLDIKIAAIDPHPTEVIVFSYPYGECSLESIRRILDCLKEMFPNNEVIAISDEASLTSCSKDVLENIISIIAERIERL